AFIAKAKEFEKAAGDRAQALKLAIEYCREHDILKEFLETHSTEVFNMLTQEWNMDKALAVRYEEGWEGGWEGGRERGREEGREEGLETTARNALAEGFPMEAVQKITGLGMDAIAKLRPGA
ncbi:MAG: hypothetical protein FWE09_07940, partial [Treponema sp.]|nr:hypothetical protein [Treponema sp.]